MICDDYFNDYNNRFYRFIFSCFIYVSKIEKEIKK